MTDLLLEDFPTRQEHAERMREATDMLIDAALKWSDEPRGSKSEENAAIDLTWACAMYRWLRGDAEYGSLRSAYAEQDEMREARQARALLATKSDEGKEANGDLQFPAGTYACNECGKMLTLTSAEATAIEGVPYCGCDG